MKKIPSLFLSSLILLALLSACGGSTSSSTKTSSTTSASLASSSVAILSSSPSSTKSDATMVKKNFDVYGPGNPTPTPLEFSTSTLYPDILFINFSLMASILVQIKGADPTQFQASLVGTLGTMTSERGAQAIFDFEKKTITFSDPELFFANVACESCLDPLGGLQANPDGTTYYLERQKGAEVVKGRALSVDLGAHEIPMILEDGNGYLPLATFSDLFLNTYGLRFLYNGVNVFLLTGISPRRRRISITRLRRGKEAIASRNSPIMNSASMAIMSTPSKPSTTSRASMNSSRAPTGRKTCFPAIRSKPLKPWLM